MIRDIINVMSSDYTLAQKVNYLKFIFYPKGERLLYDPVTISIVATTRCTLSCDMCPTHSNIVPRDYPYIQKNIHDIKFEMFREIIDRFSDALTVHIIGSGEPLLNKYFFRMVEYAASKRMRVKTFSNGTTVDENIDNILNSKLDGITISINGHDSKEFKRMTGMDEAVHSDVCAAAKRLVDERNKRRSSVKVKLSFIIDRINYRSIPDMIKLALEIGADHIFLCNFLPAPYMGLSIEERVLMAEKETIKELKAMMSSCPSRVRRKVIFPVPVAGSREKNLCDVHFSQIRFDGDGNASSCSMMLLNMEGQGGHKEEDVWNNHFFRKMRGVFLSRDEHLLPAPCKTCPDNKGLKI